MMKSEGKNDSFDVGIDLRQPYEAPHFECEELFEVLALACGKTPATVCESPTIGTSMS